MNEQKGWTLVCVGVVLLLVACLGASGTVFLWVSAFVKGMLN